MVDVMTRHGVRAVEALDYGSYAMHRRVGKELSVPGWSVTHRASGLCVWSVKDADEADRVACWLEEVDLLPAAGTREDLRQLVRTDTLRLKLERGCSSIAPRWPG